MFRRNMTINLIYFVCCEVFHWSLSLSIAPAFLLYNISMITIVSVFTSCFLVKRKPYEFPDLKNLDVVLIISLPFLPFFVITLY